VSSTVQEAVSAIRAGGVAVLPTDTVYGLAASGRSEAAARELYALKGRDATRPTALVLASVEVLRTCLPELDLRLVRIVEALLPGPYTLVLPNPARRFAWLNGARPDAIGVRVPALVGPGREVLDAVEVLIATSANLPGGPDPRTLLEVPVALREAAGAVIDGGALPGAPSTVVDLTGPEPVVVRVGAVPAADALARIAQASAR
jgi:L-threonylcarbamoyladenylate synthase